MKLSRYDIAAALVLDVVICDAAQFERWGWVIACAVVAVITVVVRRLLERRTARRGDPGQVAPGVTCSRAGPVRDGVDRRGP